MSTNSTISIITEKGGKTIYSHWDGYPSWNGKILKNHYKTQERVEELISMGNVNILHKNIGGKVEFDGFNSRKQKQCLFYTRDRGETGQKATTFSPLSLPKRNTLQTWNYLFKNGKWFVSKYNGNFIPLTHKFIKENH
jgi:hypothetical protein